VDDERLDAGVDLVQGVLERLFGADLEEAAIGLEVRNQLSGFRVELPDLVRQDRGRHIVWIVLSKVNHSLLANVFGALQRKDIGRLCSISYKICGLRNILREVLYHKSRLSVFCQRLNEVFSDFLIILT